MSPIGQCLLRHEGKRPTQVQVVGVVRDTKYNSLLKAPVPAVLIPWAQAHSPFTGRAFAARTTGDAPAMAGSLRHEDYQVCVPGFPKKLTVSPSFTRQGVFRNVHIANLSKRRIDARDIVL